MDLMVDPSRMSIPDTGIYVRAKLKDSWGSYDIAQLDKASLLEWLRSRGGENPWAENTLGILFGHGPLIEADPACPVALYEFNEEKGE